MHTCYVNSQIIPILDPLKKTSDVRPPCFRMRLVPEAWGHLRIQGLVFFPWNMPWKKILSAGYIYRIHVLYKYRIDFLWDFNGIYRKTNITNWKITMFDR